MRRNTKARSGIAILIGTAWHGLAIFLCASCTGSVDDGTGADRESSTGTGGTEASFELKASRLSDRCVVNIVSLRGCEAPCPVTASLEIACDEPSLATGGVTALPLAEGDALGLGTFGNPNMWFWSIRPNGDVSVIDLPPGSRSVGPRLLLSPGQEPVVVLRGTRPGPDALGLFSLAADSEGGFLQFMNEPPGDIRSATYSSDGLLHVWGDEYHFQLSQANAELTVEADTAFELPPELEYVLAWAPVVTTSGVAGLAALQGNLTVSLDTTVDHGSVYTEYGAGHPVFPSLVAARPPLPAAGPTAYEYFVAALADDIFRVAYSSGAESGSFLVPLPALDPAGDQCTTSGAATSCDSDPCETVQDLVVGGAYGVAQTSDGRLWISWNETHRDTTSTHELDIGLDDSSCFEVVTRDVSTTDLVIAEVLPATESVREVLRHPVEGRLVIGKGDLQAFGTDLAYVSPLPSGEDESRLVVVRVDTTLAAP